MTLTEVFGNIVGKVENASNQHFLPFEQAFIIFWSKTAQFEMVFDYVSCKCV